MTVADSTRAPLPAEPEMSAAFAAAVHRELAAIGDRTGRLRRRQRRMRALAITVGALGLAAATTGAALVVNGFPGTTTVTPLGVPVTASGTGTGTIDLGRAPAGAASVVLDVRCVSDSGRITVPLLGTGDVGDSVYWDCGVVRRPTHIDDGKLPASGTTRFTITATPGTHWTATARYASESTTAWGVNAHGETYGVSNRHGSPDLEPAQATNGKIGYLRWRELLDPDHVGPVYVYESDGTTIIGEFPPPSGSSTPLPDGSDGSDG